MNGPDVDQRIAAMENPELEDEPEPQAPKAPEGLNKYKVTNQRLLSALLRRTPAGSFKDIDEARRFGDRSLEP